MSLLYSLLSSGFDSCVIRFYDYLKRIVARGASKKLNSQILSCLKTYKTEQRTYVPMSVIRVTFIHITFIIAFVPHMSTQITISR